MNGVQLTFFNFAGYLVPGIVGLSSVLPLAFGVSPIHPVLEMIAASVVGGGGEVRGSIIAFAFLPTLAVAFLAGVLISDTSNLILSLIRSRGWFFYRRTDGSRFAALRGRDRPDVLQESADVRQALALQATAGWDLYGSAARARMCSASGFILSIAAVFYAFFSIHLFIFFGVVGLCLFVLGMKRHADYWDFVDAVVFLRITSDEEPPGNAR